MQSKGSSAMFCSSAGQSKRKKTHNFQDLGNKQFFGSVADFLEEFFLGMYTVKFSGKKDMKHSQTYGLNAGLKILMSLGFE